MTASYSEAVDMNNLTMLAEYFSIFLNKYFLGYLICQEFIQVYFLFIPCNGNRFTHIDSLVAITFKQGFKQIIKHIGRSVNIRSDHFITRHTNKTDNGTVGIFEFFPEVIIVFIIQLYHPLVCNACEIG